VPDGRDILERPVGQRDADLEYVLVPSALLESDLTGTDHALQVWSQSYLQSIHPYKDPRAPLSMQTWMQQAGFVDIESRQLMLPLNGWSNGTCWAHPPAWEAI
jgi:hypothetical protein